MIITLANFLRVNDQDGAPYAAFQRQLESLDAELVIFGLGAQAPDGTQLVDATMPPEAVALMKYLGARCRVVGVRGEFTKQVFARFAGVENTFITGCPSLFSRPEAIAQAYENWKSHKPGLFAYAGTVYHRDNETKMLVDAIHRSQFLIEPVNRFNHRLYLDSFASPSAPEVPWYLTPSVKSGELSQERIVNYMGKFYRLFRDAEPWYQFNAEHVSFTYGTRFHVNMASMLSGVPAMWITHDSRTAEMAEFLHLPHMHLDQATQMTPEEIRHAYDPTEFFDNIHSKFDNFSSFLSIFDLPPIGLDF
ncbi:polysaccharide pyruvyl transferase family protein [Propioniciclava sinopodophylli]|uniref:polysaccharide pyruvyl transferase family protein n=1 Tax=Propioniciclava sinopodophylli TaxID=1837344 RepID=UPI0013F15417|nr:polysaccharide pyruvyl transferase family protein [Propioniciclava sinopodophylli]